MKAVVGVLLMLLRVSHGAADSCDGRRDGAQYYGALGGSVELPLENDVSQLRHVMLTKSSSVFKGFTSKPTQSLIDGKIVFYSNNGSFMINDLKMSDSGEYKLGMFGKDGKETGPRTIQLCVQVPVSSVQLVHQCLSQGQINVSCLSEGDSPQYSWTLDGKTLTDSELLSGNHQTNIIVLKPYISGRLFCSVRNQVSSSSNEINIPDCGFIFINCTINGTAIAKWVYKENNTLCVEPTTVPPAVKHHSVGAAASCDGRQDGAQFYGALGGSVELPLENDVSQLRRVDLTKNGSVFKAFTNKPTESWKEGIILFYANNGSFRINDLKMSDSGEYELRMFGKDGKEKGSKTLQLCVQATVSSVQLVHQCLSQGQIKVSCLSEGDSPQYSWILDGKTHSELLSGNHQTNIIVLKPNISGRLFCSVRNQVSSSSNKINIPDCGFIFINCTINGTTIAKWVYKENNTLCVEPTTVPPTVKHHSVGPSIWLILGLCAVAVSLPIILLCLYFTWKKKKLEKSEQPDVSPTMENPGTCVLMVPLNSSP